MKKLMSIFLMLWLPLFMSSAWAMDLQMGSQKQYGMQMQAQSSASMADMPCHMESSNKQPSIETADTGCHNCSDNGAGMHDCATCGLCMISLSATQIKPFEASLLVTPSNAVRLPDSAFFSQDYPPALKPPIHS